jgi:hypothetical protein
MRKRSVNCGAVKRQISRQKVAKMREREAAVGLDPEDEAARWLAEHDPPPAAAESKSARKAKLLHQFRNRRS